MGWTSWKFADRKNRVRLKLGREAYVPCPDGTILYERYYKGYTQFAGKDIFDLVADWNREFLSQNPDFVIVNGGRKVSGYDWYPYYSDLSLSPREIEKRLREEGVWLYCTEYRTIGIDIACDDEANKALPYPIKICQSKPVGTPEYYQKLPASKADPLQGAD